MPIDNTDLTPIPARIEDLKGDVLFDVAVSGDGLVYTALGWDRLVNLQGTLADMEADIAALAAEIAAGVNDADVVHKTGTLAETITGVKTFTSTVIAALLAGGTASGGSHTIQSTTHPTKGPTTLQASMLDISSASRVISRVDGVNPQFELRPGTTGNSASLQIYTPAGALDWHLFYSSGHIYQDLATPGGTFNIRPQSIVVFTVSTGLVTITGNETISGSVAIGGGTPIVKVLSAAAALDFPSIAAGGQQELTISITGAAVGDPVYVSRPAALEAGLVVTARVTAADTVTIRASNITGLAIDPASAAYRPAVFKF